MAPVNRSHPVRTALAMALCLVAALVGLVGAMAWPPVVFGGLTGILCSALVWRLRRHARVWPALLLAAVALLTIAISIQAVVRLENPEEPWGNTRTAVGIPVQLFLLCLLAAIAIRRWWMLLGLGAVCFLLAAVVVVRTLTRDGSLVRVTIALLPILAGGIVFLWRARARHRAADRPPAPTLRQVLAAILLISTFFWWSTAELLHVRLWAWLGLDSLACDRALELPATPESQALLADLLDQSRHPLVLEFTRELESWPWLRCARSCRPICCDSPEEVAAHYHPLGTGREFGADQAWLVTLRACGNRAAVVPVGWEQGVPSGLERRSALGDIRERDWPSGTLCAAELMSAAGKELQHKIERTRLVRGPHMGSGPISGSWNREVALAYRLGHAGWRDLAGEVVCVFCGPITGPAVGITEREDGTLTWRREDGTEVTVPPVRWMPPEWASPPPRPTMPPPRH